MKRNGLKGLLSGQFDELAQQLDALSECVGQTHFGDDPVLDLVEAAQEQVKIAFGAPELVRAHHMIDQFVLEK